MIGRYAAPLRLAQDRRRADLFNNVILGVSQIRLLLLPEEEDAVAGEDGRELVGYVLEGLGVGGEG